MNHHPAQVDDNDLLHDVEKKVTEHLLDNSISESEVKKIVDSLMHELLINWGGQQVYIKKTDWGRGLLAARDIEMYEKFNGHNHTQLSKEYGITPQRVYEIIKIVKKIETAKRQNDLFPEDKKNGR